jgi:hypothetical protein
MKGLTLLLLLHNAVSILREDSISCAAKIALYIHSASSASSYAQS